MTELRSFSEDLANKPMILVASKMDVAQDPARVESLESKAARNSGCVYRIRP